jgi:hypothetical protein
MAGTTNPLSLVDIEDAVFDELGTPPNRTLPFFISAVPFDKYFYL